MSGGTALACMGGPRTSAADRGPRNPANARGRPASIAAAGDNAPRPPAGMADGRGANRFRIPTAAAYFSLYTPRLIFSKFFSSRRAVAQMP